MTGRRSKACSTLELTCSDLTSATARTEITSDDSTLIREIERDSGRPIGVLLDVQGPKLRIGTFSDGPVDPIEGTAFRLDLDINRAGCIERVKPLLHARI